MILQNAKSIIGFVVPKGIYKMMKERQFYTTQHSSFRKREPWSFDVKDFDVLNDKK